jgi:type II secretory pathway component GspD/PulD (secretin)
MVLRRFAAVIVFLAGLLPGSGTFAAELVLEVIQLRYRTVEQVLPVLQPLVPKPGTLSGMNNNLIIRTTASNLNEIRRVLDAIDRQPRRLMITVRQDADARRENQGAEISGTVSSGGARVVVPGQRDDRGASAQIGRGDDHVRARVYSTQTLDNDRSTQQIQVLEGNEAFIQVGQSVPLRSRSIVRDVVAGRVVERSVDTTEYRNMLSGFRVRPRVSGEVVTLDVSPQRDTPASEGRGSVNVQGMSTTVSGRFGEWLEIGGIVSGRSFQSSGSVYRTNAAGSDDRRILIRVDEIP